MWRSLKCGGVLIVLVVMVAAGIGIHKARWAAMRMLGT